MRPRESFARKRSDAKDAREYQGNWLGRRGLIMDASLALYSPNPKVGLLWAPRPSDVCTYTRMLAILEGIVVLSENRGNCVLDKAPCSRRALLDASAKGFRLVDAHLVNFQIVSRLSMLSHGPIHLENDAFTKSFQKKKRLRLVAIQSGDVTPIHYRASARFTSLYFTTTRTDHTRANCKVSS